MIRRYRTVLGAALALALAAGTVGCSSDDGDKAGANGKQVEKITYLTAFGAVGRDAFAWVAQEKGYFKEAGFDVNIQLGAGTDPNLKAITAGQAQFGSLDMTGVMIQAGKGAFTGVRAIATVCASRSRATHCVFAAWRAQRIFRRARMASKLSLLRLSSSWRSCWACLSAASAASLRSRSFFSLGGYLLLG